MGLADYRAERGKRRHSAIISTRPRSGTPVRSASGRRRPLPRGRGDPLSSPRRRGCPLWSANSETTTASKTAAACAAWAKCTFRGRPWRMANSVGAADAVGRRRRPNAAPVGKRRRGARRPPPGNGRRSLAHGPGRAGTSSSVYRAASQPDGSAPLWADTCTRQPARTNSSSDPGSSRNSPWRSGCARISRTPIVHNSRAAGRRSTNRPLGISTSRYRPRSATLISRPEAQEAAMSGWAATLGAGKDGQVGGTDRLPQPLRQLRASPPGSARASPVCRSRSF